MEGNIHGVTRLEAWVFSFFKDQSSLKTKLLILGATLGLGLIGLAIAVDIFQRGYTTDWDLASLYSNNYVHWIIFTSPFFLSVLFFFISRLMVSREETIEQQRSHDELQYEILEKYISDIEQGKLDQPLSDDFSNKDVALKLENFRKNLFEQRMREERRVWEGEGMAKFGDLLRSIQDTDHLSDEVVRFIVKYFGYNQGSIFIVNDENTSDPVLELKACYAFERKKYLSKSIPVGNGLVGQCYLEKDSILLYDVPADYVKITSGLGSANPKCLVIVPMKVDDTVNGVIELASFRKIEKHEIAFLEKIAAAFASVIKNTVTNARIKNLLEGSQRQTKELEAQEEELRQNMEEMQSVQEQMSRQLEENMSTREALENRERVLGETTILSEADLFGTITFVNDKFCQVSQYTSEELVGKGHNLIRHPDMPKELFRIMWARIKKGEIFKGIVKNRKKDGSHYWVDSTIVPIIENGKIVKYIGARYLITNESMAQQLFDEQLEALGLLQEA